MEEEVIAMAIVKTQEKAGVGGTTTITVATTEEAVEVICEMAGWEVGLIITIL
jgi:hypothetical protein